MTDRSRTMAYRYVIALAALAIATGVRAGLDPLLGDSQPLAAFFLATAAVATTQGFGPALVVLVGGLAVFPLLFTAPRHSFALPSVQGAMMMSTFALVGGAVAAMCAALRSARARAEAGQEELRREVERRGRAEAAILDRETRWRALIENNSDAISLVAADGTILFMSGSSARITGHAAESLVGTIGAIHIHPDDRERADHAWGRALATPGSSEVVELRLRHVDGSWRTVENVVANHRAEPAVAAMVVNTRDVTERSAMEARIAESESRFRAFMDHSPALGYLKDEAGVYVWGNRAWAAQLGRDVKDLIGEDDFALWPPDVARVFRESDRLALESGRGVEVEEANGDRRYMSLKFPLEHGGARFVGGMTLDVTDRVRAREALQRSETMLLALADSMPQIVWAAKPDGKLDYYNKRWYEFTGLTVEQTYSEVGWASVLHPDDLQRCLDVWHAAVRSGEPYEIEYRFRDCRDGAYRWHLGRGLPVRDEAGEIVRWYGTCTDIDDQKRAVNAAEDANRAKNRFLAVLSHELRTPLTPILLSVSTMLDDPSLAAEPRAALEMIRRNVELESRLIDDLLDVTRILRGTFALKSQPTDAHAVVSQALDVCRDDLRGASLEVSLDLASSSPRVLADPARLQQVFWNLLKNAAKFSPKGGSLAIRSRDDPEAGAVVIEVADQGIGIDPAFLSRLFEAFEQGEASSWTRKYGGLGLGLSISRSIVEAHGGTLTARSDGPGRGATFRVVLPAAKVETGNARQPTVVPPAARCGSSPGLRILLIEDDPSTLTVLSRLLRYERHQVTTADCVRAAMAAVDLAGDEFDLIISDIGLPDGNGVDLMRSLQSRRHYPAIALTGFGMDEDIRRTRDAGFRVHLTKPIDFRALEAAIREVVATAG
jgi:PAS domain S-box-containing protein